MNPTLTAIRLPNFTAKSPKDTKKDNKSFVIFVSFVVDSCSRHSSAKNLTHPQRSWPLKDV